MGTTIGNHAVEVKRDLDLWPWMTLKEDTEGQIIQTAISQRNEQISIWKLVGGGVGNGSLNVKEGKRVEFLEIKMAVER